MEQVLEIVDGTTETIADAIEKELTRLDLCYNNAIAFELDGAANMAENVGGVRRKLLKREKKYSLYTLQSTHFVISSSFM